MSGSIKEKPPASLLGTIMRERFLHAPYQITMGWRDLEAWLSSQTEVCALELDPDFQRGHVWTEEQQSAYVEYCLKDGKSSRIIQFNYPGWQRSQSVSNLPMQCVDGLQRITAVRKFMADELPVFGGYTLRQFDDVPSEGTIPFFLNRNGWFTLYVNELETRAEVLKWYLDLNTGGTVHTKDEIHRVTELYVAAKTNNSSF